MNKKLIRLTESDLHRIVKESVNKALNKSNSVFYDDRPSKITKVDRSNSSNKHTMSPDEIEKIHNIVSEVSVAPNGFKHRFDPNKRDGDFPLEQPKWAKDPRWQGWQGEDPEWIMKQQEKSGDPYYGNKSRPSVRVSESQLHQIVKESVEQVMNEAYSDAQYAHLAGQANGALNSFGGRLKGMFNPKWKSRKERQMRQFANQATHDNSGYERSSTNGGDNNDGGNTYKMPEHNYTLSNGGQADYIENSFNSKNQESPFEMKRTQRYVTVDDPSNVFSKRSCRAMANDGNVYSRGETRDMSNKYADNNEWDKYDEIEKFRDSNSMLNRAFQQGQNARKGYTYGGYNGRPTYKNGTGTQSGAFKRLK